MREYFSNKHRIKLDTLIQLENVAILELDRLYLEMSNTLAQLSQAIYRL